eukprot:m.135387 g.135387  ORF g.135387 m.135387 type:complete len:124 (+) comp23909_c0_seq7:421-792(+)
MAKEMTLNVGVKLATVVEATDTLQICARQWKGRDYRNFLLVIYAAVKAIAKWSVLTNFHVACAINVISLATQEENVLYKEEEVTVWVTELALRTVEEVSVDHDCAIDVTNLATLLPTARKAKA